MGLIHDHDILTVNQEVIDLLANLRRESQERRTSLVAFGSALLSALKQRGKIHSAYIPRAPGLGLGLDLGLGFRGLLAVEDGSRANPWESWAGFGSATVNWRARATVCDLDLYGQSFWEEGLLDDLEDL